MKFEDALSALRAGANIWHPTFADDEYLTACRIGFIGDEPFDEKPISIVKIKNGRQADIMAGKFNYVGKIKTQLKKILSEDDYKKYHNIYTEIDIGKIFDDDIFIYPQLNLFLVISDAWQIFTEVE